MLSKYRKEIENIDLEIARLFNKRFIVVEKIKKYKKENQIAVEDKKRETYLKLLIEKELDDKYKKQFFNLYENLLNLSKEYQK